MSAKLITVKRWRCECERCGHQWLSQSEDKPLVCYKCKAVTWDKPKKEKSK